MLAQSFGVEYWSGLESDFVVAKVEWSADVMCVCVTDPSLLQDNIKLGHTHTHQNCTPFYFCHSKI